MGKTRAIQYLRAVAVLMVALYHASLRVAPDLPEGLVAYARVGSAGVDLFFVISGLIMWTVGAARPTGPGTFLARRATRIIPLYWLVTLAYAALIGAGVFSWATLTSGHLFGSLLFVPHFSPTFPAHVFPIVVPGWTLNFEMFFYLCFALVLTVPAAWRLGALGAGLAGLVVIGAALSPESAIGLTYTSPLLIEFLIGAWIGRAWRAGRLPSGRGALALLAAGAIALACAGFVSVEDETQRVVLWGLPSALIVAGALGLPERPPQHLLLAIGDASFSIYLTHVLVLTFARSAFDRIDLPGPVESLAFLVVSIPAILVTGYATFRFVEGPGEAIVRRWSGLAR